MKTIETYGLRLVFKETLEVPYRFYFERFAESTADRIESIAAGCDDKKFNLQFDFSGRIQFEIYKTTRELCEVTEVLTFFTGNSYILTGYKGLESLAISDKPHIPKGVWILSPYKVFGRNENIHELSIPYMVVKNDNKLRIGYSRHAAAVLRKDNHLLVGKLV